MEPVSATQSDQPALNHVLLVNKNSACTPKKAWLNDYVKAANTAGVDVTIHELNDLNGLEQTVHQYLKSEDTLLVAVGGDGTLHQLVNVLMRQQAVDISTLQVASIPAGSGNDWVKTHGIPRKPIEAFYALHRAKTLMHDVGMAKVMQRDGSHTTHYFINSLGSFIDGWVGYNLQRKIFWLPHALIYWWGLIRSLPTFRYSQSTILADDKQISTGNHILANTGICRFTGGGMQLTPHALPNDGKLAITIAGKLNVFEIIKAVPLILKGSIAQHPKVITSHAESVNIIPEDNSEVHLEADGEYLGIAPARITILPGVLRVKSLY